MKNKLNIIKPASSAVEPGPSDLYISNPYPVNNDYIVSVDGCSGEDLYHKFNSHFKNLDPNKKYIVDWVLTYRYRDYKGVWKEEEFYLERYELQEVTEDVTKEVELLNRFFISDIMDETYPSNVKYISLLYEVKSDGDRELINTGFCDMQGNIKIVAGDIGEFFVTLDEIQSNQIEVYDYDFDYEVQEPKEDGQTAKMKYYLRLHVNSTEYLNHEKLYDVKLVTLKERGESNHNITNPNKFVMTLPTKVYDVTTDRITYEFEKDYSVTEYSATTGKFLVNNPPTEWLVLNTVEEKGVYNLSYDSENEPFFLNPRLLSLSIDHVGADYFDCSFEIYTFYEYSEIDKLEFKFINSVGSEVSFYGVDYDYDAKKLKVIGLEPNEEYEFQNLVIHYKTDQGIYLPDGTMYECSKEDIENITISTSSYFIYIVNEIENGNFYEITMQFKDVYQTIDYIKIWDESTGEVYYSAPYVDKLSVTINKRENNMIQIILTFDDDTTYQEYLILD